MIINYHHYIISQDIYPIMIYIYMVPLYNYYINDILVMFIISHYIPLTYPKKRILVRKTSWFHQRIRLRRWSPGPPPVALLPRRVISRSSGRTLGHPGAEGNTFGKTHHLWVKIWDIHAKFMGFNGIYSYIYILIITINILITNTVLHHMGVTENWHTRLTKIYISILNRLGSTR
jgi:hypothetical protein